jgi:streptogramin lyase
MNISRTMLCLALLSPIANVYGDVIVGVAWNYDEQSGAVFQIDPTTGATRKVGFSGYTSLNSLTQDAAGNIFSVSDSDLIKIDPWTGLGTLVKQIANFGEYAPNVRGLAVSPDGDFFAVSPYGSSFWRINTQTGETTFVGDTGFSLQSLEFGPDGNLYSVSLDAGLLRLDPATGKATPVPDQQAFAGLQSLAFSPDGTLYGVGSANSNPGLKALFRFDQQSLNPIEITTFPTLEYDFRGIVVIPEPATGVMLAVGLAALLARIRRTRSPPLVD